MNLIVVRFLLLASILSLALSAGAQDLPPVIDMHMHPVVEGLFLSDGSYAPIPCVPAGCEMRPSLVETKADLRRLFFEAMDRNNIVMAALSDGETMENSYAWEKERPKSFIIGYGLWNPTAFDTTYLRQEYDAGRLDFIGEIAAQYRGFEADTPELDQLYALAELLDLPVLIHNSGTGAPSSRFKISQGHPEIIENVLMNYPGLRIWLENAAYPFLDEVIALMYRYPNVYADLSTISWLIPRAEFWRYLEALVTAGLGNRLMWGSDSLWPGAIDIGLASIHDAPFLSQDQKRDILYNNAVEFLRLENAPTSN